MYISIRDSLVEHAGYPNIADGLKALDLSSVETQVDREFRVKCLDRPGESLFLNADEQLAQYRDNLQAAGIQVCAFLLANNFNADDRQAEIAWVVAVVESAEKLGIPAVRIDSAMKGQDELDFGARVDLFSSALSAILAETANLDVQLGIENHGSQGNDPKFLGAVLDAVDSPRLGLTLDTGNFYWSGKPLSEVYEIIERFAPLTKHTHVKNINYPESEREKTRPLGWEYGKYVCPLDQGDIDLGKVIKILRSAGYSADLTIEDECLGKFREEERLNVLVRDIQHLKNLL